MSALTKNEKLNNWIKEAAEMCRPDDIYLCNGTKEEYGLMMSKLIKSGTAILLKKGVTVIFFALIRAMWPALKIAHS